MEHIRSFSLSEFQLYLLLVCEWRVMMNDWPWAWHDSLLSHDWLSESWLTSESWLLKLIERQWLTLFIWLIDRSWIYCSRLWMTVNLLTDRPTDSLIHWWVCNNYYWQIIISIFKIWLICQHEIHSSHFDSTVN